MDGDEDQDILSDTEHAAGQVDPEGDKEVGLEGVVVIVIQNMLLVKYYI